MIIATDFDKPLEEDIIFEETDEALTFENILKNSENMMKSVMYLKRLFGASAVLSEIVKLDTLEVSIRTEYIYSETSNMLMVKNISDQNSELYINDGKLILLPFESFEFPIPVSSKIEILGNVSIVETIYKAI